MNLSYFKKPSRYINNEINSIHKNSFVNIALVFPDIYEIGMSHLGLKILYKIINDIPFATAERVFSPWTDLESYLKNYGLPLCSLESKRPLRNFDIVGFSLQYELSYTTVLNILQLGGIPIKSADRDFTCFDSRYPIIIAGGPCTVNPMPMSSFIDAFLIGDGEDAIKEIVDVYHSWKKSGDGKRESILRAFSKIEGMYVPRVQNLTATALYSPVGAGNGRVNRRYLKSLDNSPYPDSPIVPYTSIVHDRINIEVSRGCPMGCRFCQAGIIYRPIRERNPENILEIAEKALNSTGYEEVAFTSLSAGDYSCLLQVLREFNKRFGEKKISLSLPSLRVGAISREILQEIRAVKKTGFTIAPEAATERLRKVINKDFQEEDYEKALKILFEEGWQNLKMYFMVGLPTEREEDIEAIPEMAMKSLKIAKKLSRRFVNISVGISCFVPKPHTPFQWIGQRPVNELKTKKNYIKSILSKRGFNIREQSVEMSLLEAAFSRGDERVGLVIEEALNLGCRLDAWSEIFDFSKWEKAMEKTGINLVDFAEKNFDYSDILPWEKIDVGVNKEFLWKEYVKGLSGYMTVDCRKICHNCGLRCQEKEAKTDNIINNNLSTKSISLNSKLSNFTSFNRRHFKPVRIRADFSKYGKLRYLSHLELVNVIQRAIRRADFHIEYSKGFHPKPKIAFGPPLGVGFAGLHEYFDMEIKPPFNLGENIKKLNDTLPEGITINYMAVVPLGIESLNSFITRYEYEVKGGDLSYIENFLSEKEIIHKRNSNLINLRNFVEKITLVNENVVKIILIDQGGVKVRVGEILPLLLNSKLEDLDITRTALYGWKGEWVMPLNPERERRVIQIP